MSRAWLYVLGPELVWVVVCLATWWVGAQNRPATETGSQRVEMMIWWVPAVGVLLAFLTLAVPMPASRWWTYLRAALTALPGIVVVSTIICSYVDYGDSRNSGLAAAWMVAIMVGCLALGVALLGGGLSLWLGPKLLRD